MKFNRPIVKIRPLSLSMVCLELNKIGEHLLDNSHKLEESGFKVIALDLRNHGESPHNDEMSFDAMCSDVTNLLKELGIKKATLLGHSLGGKVAMVAALLPNTLVDRLVVVDVAPVRFEQADTNLGYAQCLRGVKFKHDLSLFENRKHVDSQLQEVIQDAGIRSFLLLNLVQTDVGTQWRLNIDAIINNYTEICEFPQTDRTYLAPTMFISGQRSNYISEKSFPVIQRLFPNSELQVVADAGHWVHVDQPRHFVNIVNDFLHRTMQQ